MMVGQRSQATWHRLAPWFCFGLMLTTGLALAFTGVLAALNQVDSYQLPHVATTAIALLVGGIVAARRPANPVGWLILGHALCFSLGEFTRQYALYGLITQPGSLPLAIVFASPPYWIWWPGIACGFILWPLFFPNGHLLSPRWRVVVWFVIATTVVATAIQVFYPGDWETPGIPNPLGVPALADWDPLVGVASQFFWIGSAAVALASLAIRYRRAGELERLQIRWPAYAVGLALGSILADRLLPVPLPELVIALSLGVIWIAIGIAILRYRLFDIDVIIKRTLVYGLLTATLLAVYFGAVVALQALLRPVTGQDSDLAIVASTLAIAALFQPLRRRIQAFIDRRFFRRRYDAAAILAAYGTVLRDEVDLRQLTGALLGVVGETVQPAHATVWLREGHDG